MRNLNIIMKGHSYVKKQKLAAISTAETQSVLDKHLQGVQG